MMAYRRHASSLAADKHAVGDVGYYHACPEEVCRTLPLLVKRFAARTTATFASIAKNTVAKHKCKYGAVGLCFVFLRIVRTDRGQKKSWTLSLDHATGQSGANKATQTFCVHDNVRCSDGDTWLRPKSIAHVQMVKTHFPQHMQGAYDQISELELIRHILEPVLGLKREQLELHDDMGIDIEELDTVAITWHEGSGLEKMHDYRRSIGTLATYAMRLMPVLELGDDGGDFLTDDIDLREMPAEGDDELLKDLYVFCSTVMERRRPRTVRKSQGQRTYLLTMTTPSSMMVAYLLTMTTSKSSNPTS